MKRLKFLCIFFLIITISAASVALITLKASLPQLDGTAQVPHLEQRALVERDGLGIPTLIAESRNDIARALGYVHAQDRFFQMDLLRRSTSGELSELFGRKTLEMDKKKRIHQVRKRAQESFKHLSQREQDILIAYTEGVNAALSNETTRPWEYFLLGKSPARWLPEDSLVVGYALFFALQDSTGESDIQRGVIKRLLPEDVFTFMISNGSTWSAALDGSKAPHLPIPSEKSFSYLKEADVNGKIYTGEDEAFSGEDVERLGGSNQWAWNGGISDGKENTALFACDMHLKLQAPNIWYRARLLYNTPDGSSVDASGATLPGSPLLVVGSNRNIAWGFTNSFIDTAKTILLEEDVSGQYLTQDGPLPYEEEIEEILLPDGSSEKLVIKKTLWGPVLPVDFFGNKLAYHWIAHEKTALNLRLIDLETTRSTSAALDISKEIEIPLLNFMVADSSGNIGWTLIGSTFDTNLLEYAFPVPSRSLPPHFFNRKNKADYPVMTNPKNGYLFTANNRPLGGDKWFTFVGNHGFLNPIRAHQIESRLSSMTSPEPSDMLALQLDARAPFFNRWRDLLIQTLEKEPATKERILLKEKVLAWSGSSDASSEGYFWIRNFREKVKERVLSHVLAPCFAASPEFTFQGKDFEEPLYLIASEQPDYLASPKFGTLHKEWSFVIDELIKEHPLETSVWGHQNRLLVDHPFTKAYSFLGRFLNLPESPLDGDFFTPRVAGKESGASQRFVVTPGKEEEGIFHMPGGQSGHPMSPHYLDGHDDWIQGRASPLLPGKAIHRLELLPEIKG